MEKTCETCRFAIFDSVPYGSTNADYLSGCQKDDEIENEIEDGAGCPFWQCNDD